jgi:hypothetical protein
MAIPSYSSNGPMVFDLYSVGKVQFFPVFLRFSQ